MKLRHYVFMIAGVALPLPVWAAPLNGYVQTNLVSNIPGLAAVTDPNLVNPWGIAMSASSPFWISDNGSGKATLYNSVGTAQALVVTIPGGTPTGQVFNSTTNFNSDLFIFATEGGAIAGWRGALGTTAEVLFDGSASGAVYKGVAMGVSAGNQYLYAADFHNAQITVFPGTGAPALTGTFTDPNLPAGYAPFGMQNIGGVLYVTYAQQDAAGHDDVPGAGHGFVDIFNLDGTFSRRLVTAGALNSPWGLTLAPPTFGPAAGDLLVGNFGDGTINAYDPVSGGFIGTLATQGNSLVNDGLWGLTFGNGGNGGTVDSLYLTAGLNNEADGLLARIDAVPEPSSLVLILAGMGAVGVRRAKLRV